MLFDTIPRGSVAAAFTAADIQQRLIQYQDPTNELRHAACVVCSYITNQNSQYTTMEYSAAALHLQTLYN